MPISQFLIVFLSDSRYFTCAVREVTGLDRNHLKDSPLRRRFGRSEFDITDFGITESDIKNLI